MEEYKITDGKYYVALNPFNSEPVRTSYPLKAALFSHSKAKKILRKKEFTSYYIVDLKDKRVDGNANKGKENIYIGYEFEEEVIDNVNKLLDKPAAKLNANKLRAIDKKLKNGQSFYDSALSDIKHARMDCKLPAHLMTKVDKLANNLEEKRRDLKQAMQYIHVMQRCVNQDWSEEKYRKELKKARYCKYKGRTEYYNIVINMVKQYKKGE